MNSIIARAKDTYQVLPPSVRNAAASGFSYYLRWWRYGGGSDARVAQALHRDRWTAHQWHRYREEAVATMLTRAATRVPFYRDHWRARRDAGDMAPWDDLRNWPVLKKEDLRSAPSTFLAEDVRPSRLFRISTSGTSGSPITTWRSLETMRAWYALFEARTRRWYGVDRHMNWAILGGQLVTPAAQREPPFWVWSSGLRQLYMSTLHLAPANAGAYLDAMRRYGVRHLFGYASSMYWLAHMASEQGFAAPRLIVAVSNAEPLHDHQRRLIGEVFDCPVRDTYGMSEIVAAASECECGVLHVWPDAGIIEVLDDTSDEAAAEGVPGRLVCTGLLNPDMPLIRYEVGDRGVLGSDGEQRCDCGRTLPSIERIEGRSSDNLVTVDGRRVFWINPVFYELPVREAQVIQESLGTIRVKAVVAAGFDQRTEEAIEQRLKQRLGAVEVITERVETIPRGPNGKFRPVINRIDEVSK